MPKILQSIAIARWLGILVLALVIVLPCGAATPALKTLYNFTDLSDGGFPEAGLVMASNGAMYGTTSSSASGSGWGSVFQMIPVKGGTWTQKTLYDFTGGADGANPIADLVVTSNNVLYGTTYGGGKYGYGTVFQIAPTKTGTWVQKVLYSFAGGSDGANPAAGVALLNGTLYGTTYNGGSAGMGMGTVFQLTSSLGVWTETVLYSFMGGVDGANPLADLVIGTNGALYGTTFQGGSVTITNQPPSCTTTSPCTYQNWGTVFELTNARGTWTENVLYTFLGGSDGGNPESALILGPGGVLYGSTFWGGTPTSCAEGDYPQGCGVIYQVAPPTGTGTTWTQTVLHTFTGQKLDGAHPYGNMALSTAGTLFGTTYSGGQNVDTCFSDSFTGCGTVFTLRNSGGTWTKSNLMSFTGSPSGGTPNGVILANGGDLYGTTIVGGNAGGYGTVFQMIP